MTSSIIANITKDQLRADVPTDIEIGDTVRVHINIKDEKGEKERAQVFEGVVMRWRRGGINSTITVRKISHGVGVERIFPVHSPSIAKIELKAKGVVRRARLYYLRDLTGKAARIKARSTAKK